MCLKNKIIAITPSTKCNPNIAIAAQRAGAIGILDLCFQNDSESVVRQKAIKKFIKLTDDNGGWGFRCELAAPYSSSLKELKKLSSQKPRILLLAGSLPKELKKVVSSFKQQAQYLFYEATSVESAISAQDAGFDGLVIKGNEASGIVGEQSSFIFTQHLHNKLVIPYWIQGGVGPHTAAALCFSGATGVVLSEHTWLTEESPFSSTQKKIFERFDGTETEVILKNGALHRVLTQRHSSRIIKTNHDTTTTIETYPLSQDISFATYHKKHFGTVGRIIEAYQKNILSFPQKAADQKVLSKDSNLAKSHGTKYPIVQGPMSRVSDTADFASSVANAGALAFLALSVINGKQLIDLLEDTKKRLGNLKWGVGILGFMPKELRKEQLNAILKFKPPYALISGGTPKQAMQLEELGIETYLHTPSPRLLKLFLKQGIRKFILEGSECGGHTGPRSSLLLWEHSIQVLLDSNIEDPENVQILFAGGIHNDLSAAMVSNLIVPIIERGMKCGVLMGSAYLMTSDAVKTGAILEEFQQQALECTHTTVLQSGLGHLNRCASTSYSKDFLQLKEKLQNDHQPPEVILRKLEELNLGRLRIATKGIIRKSTNGKPKYIKAQKKTQKKKGMYMIGEVATLHSKSYSISDLHHDVSQNSKLLLNKFVTQNETLLHSEQIQSFDRNIAVVGMSCILPGAQNIKQYWENIVQGLNLVSEINDERWRPEDFFDSDRFKADQIYSKWGGFLEDYPFDATHYGIPPNTLKSIEPIQLLALETARLALIDAGFDHLSFNKEKTAVIFGAGGMHDLGIDYIFRTMLKHYLPKVSSISKNQQEAIIDELSQNELPEWNEDSFPGVLGNVTAGRIANRLDLNGSNYTVDAACGSSLAALDVAIHKLRAGTADVVLVGAADGTNNAPSYMAFSKVQALSPRGRSRPFDESADGIAIGEGVVTFVLKRLNDAERVGDKIYAVIKGIGSSSDGRNRSLTAPHPKGQVRAVERAYADADIPPETVELVEAHGTGTPVGDKSEIESLQLAFNQGKTTKQYCALGSVKSMIGHTKVSAGMAGMAKSVLALHQKILPPTIGINTPNSHIDLKTTPFFLNTKTRPWLNNPHNHPRRCGVSAFGFGGTNFHMVLEEYTTTYRDTDSWNMMPKNAELITILGTDRETLSGYLTKLLSDIRYPEYLELPQLAYSIFLSERNKPLKDNQCRLAIIATDTVDFMKLVQKSLQILANKTEVKANQGIYLHDEDISDTKIETGKICFLFPGQGAQKLNMLKDLLNANTPLYKNLDTANQLLKNKLDSKLSDYIYPLPVFDKRELASQQQALNDTHIAQPAIAVTDINALDILTSFGFTPDAVAGHSFGEFIALTAAGVISRQDLYGLAENRGRLSKLSKAAGNGTMLAIQANYKRVKHYIDDMKLKVSVANINSNEQTVVAGKSSAISEAAAKIKTAGIVAQILPVTAPFHTKEMDDVSLKLKDELKLIDFHKPKCKVYSNTLGASYPDAPNEIRKILGQHIAKPVKYLNQIEQMYKDGIRTFIEVGPGRIQSNLVDKILQDKTHTTLQLDNPSQPGWQQLAHLLGKSWVMGLDIDIQPWFSNRDLKPVSIDKLIQDADRKANPGPLVWRVNGDKSVPWNQKEKPEPEETNHNDSSITDTSIEQKEQTTRQAFPALNSQTVPSHSQVIPIDREKTMKKHNSDSKKNTEYEQINALKIQENMMQFIELQKEQQQTMNRLIAIQEQLVQPLLGANGSNQSINPSKTHLDEQLDTPTSNITSSIKKTTASAPVAPPLAPISVKPSSTPVSDAAALMATPVAAPDPNFNNTKNNVATPVATPNTAINTDTSVSFKTALLKAVSERTGYPIDMLDLDAHMEADLGIDSIKRVEIFSSLEGHQSLLQGTSEESLLEELADLKTLNKIIGWYETNQSRANEQEAVLKKV